AGLRYARSSPALRRVLGRATAFLLFAAAPWALLPLVARGFVGGGPGLYGLLLAAIGLGAVAGALLLPMLRTRLGLGADGTVLAGTLGVALAAAGMATAPAPWLAILSCLLLGLAWIGVLTSLNVAAQSALPDWVRARGLALYLSVFSGSMMTGGLAWGIAAEFAGVPAALAAAAGLGLLAGVLVRGVPLPEGGGDLVPSDHMPGHEGLAFRPDPMAGPVLVLVEYRLREPEERDALLAALRPLEQERRRDGAVAWWAFADPADRLRVVEGFLMPDWAEHERMHVRATRSGVPLHEAANAFDVDGRPRVRHLVGARLPPA
ncbi:MAG TPA: MFS transporter, partial [Acetobacteraceae bacterium]|nr:MFS transporter [Acetobacteraceae bacterium]